MRLPIALSLLWLAVAQASRCNPQSEYRVDNESFDEAYSSHQGRVIQPVDELGDRPREAVAVEPEWEGGEFEFDESQSEWEVEYKVRPVQNE